jgi:hypothetical protein
MNSRKHSGIRGCGFDMSLNMTLHECKGHGPCTFVIFAVTLRYICCETTIPSLHTNKLMTEMTSFLHLHFEWSLTDRSSVSILVGECQLDELASKEAGLLLLPCAIFRWKWDMLLLRSFAYSAWCQLELAADGKNQGRLNLRHGFRNSLWLPRHPALLL